MMVDLALLQAVSYIMGSLGVFVAAAYYVYNMRKAERDRRKQNILHRMPTMSREFYIWNLEVRHDPSLEQDWDKKYRVNPELESKVWHIMNVYNSLGILYVEGLMSLKEVTQLYSPGWIIGWYDKFEFLIKMLRYDGGGDLVYPEYMEPFERLVNDLRSRYPGVTEQQRTLGEEVKRLLESDADPQASSQ